MDAHLFRAFCEAAAPLIEGARLAKIQEPADGVLTFNLDLFARQGAAASGLSSGRLSAAMPGAPGHGGAFGRKVQLVLRAGRKEPFLFLSATRMAADRTPSAAVMRLRKYAAGHSVRHVVIRWLERELWFLMSGPRDVVPGAACAASGETLPGESRVQRPGDTRPSAAAAAGLAAPAGTPSCERMRPGDLVWLVLDLREGARLAFLPPGQAPTPSAAVWPGADEVDAAMGAWRQWPVLTPALRRALLPMDGPDRAALLYDLELGGGDIFLYTRGRADADGPGGPGRAGDAAALPPAVARISCWPLSPEAAAGLHEEALPDVLDACQRAGADLVLVEAARQRARVAALPLERREKRLRALLERQEEDERRLSAMRARRADALLLRAWLWRWDKGAKVDHVEVEDIDGVRTVRLEPRWTIRENMERLFHQAARGERGLAHVQRRREELSAELDALRGHKAAVLMGAVADADRDSGLPRGETARGPVAIPRVAGRVQVFVSSDGFILLRGRDARGNLDVRRAASPHDIWVHAAGGPGSHVIIRRSHAGVRVPDRTLDEAGVLAACRSWLREEPRARLTYCEVRHVKPLRGAAPGTMRMDKVLFTREVAVDASLEAKLSPAN